MSSYQKVVVMGNLGQDPEVRFTQTGTCIANLSVATSEKWKDKQTGEQKEQTEWHRVVLFNRLGEIAGEYLQKGAKVLIEGQLRTRKWQAQDGSDRYSTEIVGREMKMLGGTKDASPDKRDMQNSQPAPPPPAPDFDDDIPF